MSQRDRRRAGRAFGLVVVAVMGLAGSCRTVPRTEPQVVPSAPPASVDLRVPPPVLRVGVVVDAARASVAADSGVVLTSKGAPDREERGRARPSPRSRRPPPTRAASACRSRA